MNILYLLGGPPRTAKTTIMSELVAEKHVQFVATDAIVHGLRNVLVGEPHQMLKGIELNGSAEFKTSFTEVGNTKQFSAKITESEMTLGAIIGMVDYYGRNGQSVAFEGSVITPNWVSGLSIANFTVRAAFVGYTSPNHADAIIAHAKQQPDDWVNSWLEKDGGDETKIRQWVSQQAQNCHELKQQAELHGLPFFDISAMPFDEYKASVYEYFLG